MNDDDLYSIDYEEVEYLKRKFNRKLKGYRVEDDPWLIPDTLTEIKIKIFPAKLNAIDTDIILSILVNSKNLNKDKKKIIKFLNKFFFSKNKYDSLINFLFMNIK